MFFCLLDKQSPKFNRLHKIFNKSTVKVSYSCMGSVRKIIKSHNKGVTKTNKRSITPCNCRDKNNCSMNWNYGVENVVKKCVSPSKKSRRNTFTLMLLRVIGSRATAITQSVQKSETQKWYSPFMTASEINKRNP